MKTIILFSVLLCCASLSAATIDLPGGVSYDVSDWSQPTQVILPADNGKTISVIKRVALVKRLDSEVKAQYSIEILYEPGQREVWLSIPNDQYFVFGGKIYGLRNSGTRFLFRKSTTAGPTLSETQIEAKALSTYLNDPGSHYMDMETGAFELAYSIGGETLRPLDRSDPIEKTVTFTSIQVGDGTFTVSAQTVVNNQITLIFDSKLNILQATKNGNPVLLLQQGRFPFTTVPMLWPRQIALPSDEGTTAALGGGTLYHYTDNNQQQQSMFVGFAVNPATGGVWFGPDDASKATLGGKTMGALYRTRNGAKELYVFGEYGTMATTGDTVASFQSLLKAFTAELSAGTFKEKVKINLQALPGVEIPNVAEINQRKVDVQGGNMRITLGVGGLPDKFQILEVLIDRDLKLVSASLHD